tara:strand:- start:152 stop:667 length:516 start_codon:yes stop_codon:yes gene_type:complete
VITLEDVRTLEKYMRVCCADICNNKQLIDDAIQNTYLYLLERQQSDGLEFLEWNGKANKHYLRRVATSQLLMALRTDQRRERRNREYVQLHGEFEHIESKVDHNVKANQILDALETLPPYDRELLKLVYFRKVTQKSLSNALEIPYTTIKQDVKRARETIRKKVDSDKKKR